jgi:hypothetical protein
LSADPASRALMTESRPHPVPVDQASIARGRHLVKALTFCEECRGQALGGDFLADMQGSRLYTPLT